MVDLPATQAMQTLGITQFDSSAPPVLLASWFIAKKRDSAWLLQEASLLWNSNCVYPAFETLVHKYYQVDAVPDSCGE